MRATVRKLFFYSPNTTKMINLKDHLGKFDTSKQIAEQLNVGYLVNGGASGTYPNNLADLVTDYLKTTGIEAEEIINVRKIMFEALYLQKLHMIRAIENRIENLKHFEL